MNELLFPKENDDDFSCVPKLTFTEKLIAFVILNVVGYILQLGSYFRFLTSLVGNDSERFALAYSIGNLLSLLGTCIMIGFKNQIKNIVHKNRRLISAIFFGSLFLCIISPIIFPPTLSKIVVTLAVAVQMVSYWWYTLSYLPWARSILSKLCYCCFSIFKR